MEKISRRGGGEGEKGKARTERVTPKQQNKTTKVKENELEISKHNKFSIRKVFEKHFAK